MHIIIVESQEESPERLLFIPDPRPRGMAFVHVTILFNPKSKEIGSAVSKAAARVYIMLPLSSDSVVQWLIKAKLCGWR